MEITVVLRVHVCVCVCVCVYSNSLCAAKLSPNIYLPRAPLALKDPSVILDPEAWRWDDYQPLINSFVISSAGATLQLITVMG